MTTFELNDTIEVFCSKGERKYFTMRIADMTPDFIETLLAEGVSRILNDSHSGEPDIEKARAIFEEKMEQCENMETRFGAGGFGKTRLTPFIVALRSLIKQAAIKRKVKPANIPDLERAGMDTIRQWAEEEGHDVEKAVATVTAKVEALIADTADLF